MACFFYGVKTLLVPSYSMPDDVLEELTLPVPDEDPTPPGYYRISASQIKTYLDCKRKWAWIYIANIRPPSGEAASFGQRTHSILEDYQKTGIAWDHTTEEGRVARKALQFLPAPDPNALTEASFTFDTVRTGDDRPVSEGRHLLFNGFIDLTLPPNYEWEHTSPYPTIIDYKTCGTTQYALTVTTLPEDPQAVIYAYHAMAKYQTTHADLMWLYLPRRTSTPLPVKVRLDWETTKTKFRKLEVLAREIERTHDAVTDPLTLPPTESSCDKYGGCPFKGRCNLQASKTPQQRQEEFMGFIEDMAARRAAEQSAVQPPAAGSTVVTTPSGNNTFSPEFLAAAAPVSRQEMSTANFGKPAPLVEALAQRINPPEAPSLTTYDPKLPIGQSAPLYPATNEGAVQFVAPGGYAPAVVPTEPLPVTSAIPSSGHSTSVPVVQVYQDPITGPTLTLGIVPSVPVPGTEQTVSEEKPKRTRRTKAQMEAARAAETAGTSISTEILSKVQDRVDTEIKDICDKIEVRVAGIHAYGGGGGGTDRAPEVFESQPGDVLVTPIGDQLGLPDLVQIRDLAEPVLLEPLFTLYINCAPSWPHKTADTYIARVQANINKTFGVADYRCIDFGKGRGILANEVKELAQNEIASGELQHLVIYTNNPEGQEVLSGLVALAGNRVVRA